MVPIDEQSAAPKAAPERDLTPEELIEAELRRRAEAREAP